MAKAPGTGFKYLYRETTRHETVIYRFRWGHIGVQINDPIGSPEFHLRYGKLLAQVQAAKAGLKIDTPANSHAVQPPARAKPKTFRWLCEKFFQSPAFKAPSSARTQYTGRQWLESCCGEPYTPTSHNKFADCPLEGKSALSLVGLEILRDRKVKAGKGKRGGLGAANNRVRALKRLFFWAVKHKHIAHNIAADLEYLAENSDGHHTWTDVELQTFEKHHRLGTKARLALDLFQYTGMAISDIVKASPRFVLDDTDQHGNPIKVYRENRTKKVGGKTKGVEFSVGMCPALLKSIAATDQIGIGTFLVTHYGKPFASPTSFGNKFRDWCQQAGLPKHCTPHGIRKAAATRAANNGATSHELMAMFGWLTLKEAQHYTEQANRRKLGLAGARLLSKS